jgi:hypothetical protein
MRMTYLLARDHLEQASAILETEDAETRQIQNIVQRVINLIDRTQRPASPPTAKIIDFMRTTRRRR